jgi:5'-nucleotidase
MFKRGAISLLVILSLLPVWFSPASLAAAQAQEVTIPQIQGEDQFSPYAGQEVTTQGVVTLVAANGEDFWLQDPAGDQDPATSDGIFVQGEGSLYSPQVGDMLSITATVDELQFGNALPLTRLEAASVINVLSSGNRLPAPVLLRDLPNELITDGIDFWEPKEGMLVEVKSAKVIAPTNAFGEFGVLVPRDLRPSSGFFASTSQILLNESEAFDTIDYNPERIMIDDFALDTPDVRPGDSIAQIIGVVDYTFSMYKLQLSAIEGVNSQPIPSAPVSERSQRAGNVSITTFNVENLFDLEDNPDKADEDSTPAPEELEVKLSKLNLAIQLELVLPEVLVLQEVENQAILQELGDRVNAASGTDYRATSFETSDERGIEVGFLWDAERVILLEAFQMSGPDVEAAFGPGSASPGREPLVGKFVLNGNINSQPVWIIGNHFKSKSGDDPLYGVNQPPIRSTEEQRKLQARAVRDFVNNLFASDPEAQVMVTGDLNDFQFAEPGEGEDHPVGILEGSEGETPLTNLIQFENPAETFSFIFDGNSQVLDHMLVSPALMEHFRGADFLHFNTSYPAFLSEDPSTPLQSADHDPLEGRFLFEQTGTDYSLTVLHNNDGESQLINAGSGIEDFGGVARFATLVDHLRSEASAEGSGVLMVSSGDNFLAGPEFTASLEKGVPFYDTIAMQLIGYDAAAIGNHEFDFGPEVLADFIEGFNGTLPFVSANLDFSGEPSLQALVDQGVIVKSLAIEEAGETIGIVGATTPFLPFISSPRNVTVDPEVAAAIQGQVDQLQAQGIDKIMVISHLQAVAEDVALAAELSGVDIMIAGGGDEVLANPGDLLVPGDEIQGPYPLYATGADGTVIPVVTTAGNYKYVGQLIVEFLGGTLVWVENESGPVRVAGGDNPDAVEPDPEVQAQVVEPVMASIAELANNVIGQSEVDLDGLRNNVRTQETNEGNLIADALLWQAAQLADTFGVAPPDVALQNGGGIRNDSIIPAGPITELNTFEMLPFANFVSIVPDVPREQFKEIMENAVSRVEFVDGRFAQIAGFDMVWDPSGTPQVLDENGNVVTPGTRVLEITLDDGTPIVSGGAVVDGPALSVATIDFLARGGDQYPFRGVPFTTLGVTYQQALSDYIVEALDGLITAAQYPFGGEGRITTP